MTDEDRAPTHLLNLATEVFGDDAKARRWLARAHHALDGMSPAEAARCEDGFSEVTDLLGRIEHGVYE